MTRSQPTFSTQCPCTCTDPCSSVWCSWSPICFRLWFEHNVVLNVKWWASVSWDAASPAIEWSHWNLNEICTFCCAGSFPFGSFGRCSGYLSATGSIPGFAMLRLSRSRWRWIRSHIWSRCCFCGRRGLISISICRWSTLRKGFWTVDLEMTLEFRDQPTPPLIITGWNKIVCKQYLIQTRGCCDYNRLFRLLLQNETESFGMISNKIVIRILRLKYRLFSLRITSVTGFWFNTLQGMVIWFGNVTYRIKTLSQRCTRWSRRDCK